MKKCTKCEKEFIPNSRANECSMKCRIKANVQDLKGCWEWQGKIGKNGYGWIRNHCKDMLVHRLSYEVFVNPIPAGMHVCHSCDNRKCCNPDHLWIGTAKENIQDAKKKGKLRGNLGYRHPEETKRKFKYRRHADRKGEKHHLSKLSESEVNDIKILLKNNFKQKEIAKKYGIDQSTISYIKTGRLWKHI